MRIWQLHFELDRDVIKKTVRRCNCIPVLFAESIPVEELNQSQSYPQLGHRDE